MLSKLTTLPFWAPGSKTNGQPTQNRQATTQPNHTYPAKAMQATHATYPIKLKQNVNCLPDDLVSTAIKR